MSRFPSRRLATMHAVVVVQVCGMAACDALPRDVLDSPSEREPVTAAVPSSAPTQPTPAVRAEGAPDTSGCLRGGTPRDEVRRIMGEPDSVVWGSWLYGESEVLFGYGVVVETRNRGELPLCDGP